MEFFQIPFLIDFTPIKPGFGLLLWTTVIFALFWLIMKKLAFGPIGDALKNRANTIQEALDEAKRTREEMSMLQAENEKILQEARTERTSILKSAKDTANEIVTDAKSKAKEEAKKIMVSAQQEIENQKKSALIEVKNEIGKLVIDATEKVLREELKNPQSHEELIGKIIDETRLN